MLRHIDCVCNALGYRKYQKRKLSGIIYVYIGTYMALINMNVLFLSDGWDAKSENYETFMGT